MPLCQLCDAIDIAAVLDSEMMNGRYRENYPKGHDLFVYGPVDVDYSPIAHHRSVEALTLSAKACALCGLVEDCFNMTLSNLRKAIAMGFSSYKLSGYQFWVSSMAQAEGLEVLGSHPDDPLEYLVLGGIRFCVDDESPLRLKGRKVSPWPNLTKIKAWIEQCREHQHAQYTRLPTRVLKIEFDKVVLQESVTVGDYITLSHCWGKEAFSCLNKDTAEHLALGVMTNTLPQSFQDAILLTSQLGFQFLWIDSLCITQDDVQDWKRESEQMAEVYQNSFLTISASRAASSLEGFLSKRLQPTYIALELRFGDLHHNIFAFTVPSRHAVETYRCADLSDEPLTKRGWALQERYLARRTLHFERFQTYFECDRGFFTEDGRVYRGRGYRLLGPYENQISLRHWHNIINQYSRRELTIEGDKLPALAGLAKRFASSTNRVNQYRAGLWLDDIIRDMCWYRNTPQRAGPEQPSESRIRPQNYIAPTWSWASIKGVIGFHELDQPLAMVEEVHVDLDTPGSPYGKVTGGWIHLRAVKLQPRSIDNQNNHSFLWFEEHGVNFYMYIEWDAEPCELPESAGAAGGDQTLFAVPLGWYSTVDMERDTIFGPFCLIVRRVEHNVATHAGVVGFERVGAGLAQWEKEHKVGLRRLIVEEWTDAKENMILV
ncbi:hypothetical protein BP6252_14082 [Coleophoma cylindrospora]|uniref:Heterokaryon incompatibility domain-containing protein n=1 Tax=Coleophoma cylindrospora TaxID=1849047 RepID=A0A3D8Q4E7_9HELO|nr:hypothetical protein BP6252_14082 [Coleophoma cylindrospora]